MLCSHRGISEDKDKYDKTFQVSKKYGYFVFFFIFTFSTIRTIRITKSLCTFLYETSAVISFSCGATCAQLLKRYVNIWGRHSSCFLERNTICVVQGFVASEALFFEIKYRERMLETFSRDTLEHSHVTH